MNIRHLDGQQFKNMILAGAHRVIDSQEELNNINVFPVPDGDTGSNMAALFLSIVHTLGKSKTSVLADLMEEVADAALNGSRGNSGAILAQFFQGAQQSIGHHDPINLEQFAAMAKFAAAQAREAISNPVEGTIITVMHDWATFVTTSWQQAENFADLVQQSLEAAQQALYRTPQQLEVLSRNQVVDAGAQGFVNFLAGAAQYLQTGWLPEAPAMDTSSTTEANRHERYVAESLHLDPHTTHSGDLNNQYCTECIIHGHQLDVQKIKQTLSPWGDSFVIVGGNNKVKVHIHTNAPSRLFREANAFGELLETKADDMWAQYRARTNYHLNKQITIVTDSSCNLPQEFFVRYNIIVLPMQIIIDNVTYLDRVNLNLNDFLTELKNPHKKISTSQPAPADIKIVLHKAVSQSPVVIGIFVSAKLSGTYQAICQMAKKLHEEEELYLFDSRNTSAALGLIVGEAAKAVQAGKSVASVQKLITDSIENTQFFISLATLKYAIRGGRVGKSTGWIANLLRLLPVLKIDSSGTTKKVGFAFGKKANQRKMIKLAVQYAKKFRHQEIIVAHADALEDANLIGEILRKKFPEKTIDVISTTPIVLTHSGPGTVAIAVLGK